MVTKSIPFYIINKQIDPEYFKCDLKCQCLIFRIYCAIICIDVFDTLIVFNTHYWCKICSSDVLYLLYSILTYKTGIDNWETPMMTTTTTTTNIFAIPQAHFDFPQMS